MTYYLYKDNHGEWRWRLKSSNGRVLADSGEGYKNLQHCKEAIARLSRQLKPRS
jgi:uncharacterized protein YegP (UPF0339 family)